MAERLMNKRDACTYLKVSLATLNRFVRNGLLVAIKLGKRLVRFKVSDLERFAESQKD